MMKMNVFDLTEEQYLEGFIALDRESWKRGYFVTVWIDAETGAYCAQVRPSMANVESYEQLVADTTSVVTRK
jgi:hypothetical protein